MNVNTTNNKNYMIGDKGEIKRIDMFNKVGMLFLTFITIFLIMFCTFKFSEYRGSLVDVNNSSHAEIIYKTRHYVITEDKINIWIQNRPYKTKYGLIDKNVLTLEEFERIEHILK